MGKIRYTATVILLLVTLVASPLMLVQGQEVTIPEEQTFYFTKPETWRGLQLNPLSSGATGIPVLVYERLAISDDASILFGAAEIRPILAESWRWVDDTTFEVKIRRIAHFRSGHTVTADDVLFSLETEMKPELGAPIAFMKQYVEGLEKIDDYTIRVKVKPENAKSKLVFWILVGSYVLPKYKWSPLLEQYGTDIINYKETDFEAVDGSGPYTPIALPESAVVLKRVDNYWGEQLGWQFAPEYVYLTGDRSSDIQFRMISEHKRDLNSESAEISLEWQRERSSYLGAWNIYGEGGQVHGTESGCKGVSLNYEKIPLLRERWLREALTYAVDYNKISEAALYSQALPANHLSIYALSYPDYIEMTKEVLEKNFEHVVVDTSIPRLAYDPELAIEILKEHCDEGSSVETGWKYKGQKIGGWRLNTVAEWRSWMTAAEILSKGWKDIGIDIEPNPIEVSPFLDAVARADFDLTYNWIAYGTVPTALEDAMTQAFGYKGYWGTGWNGKSATGFQGFWNGSFAPLPNVADEVSELVRKLWVQETRSAEHKETFKRICELVIPELPFIPTAQDGSMKIYNHADRWNNFPTIDDPYEYRIFDCGVNDLCWHILKHVYPAKVEAADFKISKSSVEVGETLTATVTLRNNGEQEQRYKVAVNLGPAKSGWELTEEGLLAWKIVKVPPGEMKVELPITIKEEGSYVLVVDNWRIGAWDPGDPLMQPLSVAVPTPAKTVTITETSTVTETTTTEKTVSVPTMDVTSVAGAGVVALVVGVAVGWLVASRKKS